MIRPGSRRGLSALNGVSGALVGVPDSQGMFRSRSRDRALVRVVNPSHPRLVTVVQTPVEIVACVQTSDPTQVLTGK